MTEVEVKMESAEVVTPFEKFSDLTKSLSNVGKELDEALKEVRDDSGEDFE